MFKTKTKLGARVMSMFLSLLMAASMLTVLMSVQPTEEVSAAGDYGLADNIQDGTILHCFDWKYNDIKAELPNIAEAGFTSVQTSPASQACGTGPWYWAYQPLGFYIGNTFGTKEELKALCDEAENYGIKVIVDVIGNHLAGGGWNPNDNIQSDLKDQQYWHRSNYTSNTQDGTGRQGIDWKNRWQVTHGDVGMPDLNTEHSYVQECAKNYLLELKSVGVDGIRWDTAKHISLPSEGDNFWPTVASAGLYMYGEILEGPDDRDSGNEGLMKEYTNYMSVTDNNYGSNLAGNFRDGKVTTMTGKWANKGLSPSKLVYWGESHDTYANDVNQGGWTKYIDQNVIDRAYAIAASRADATALYFSRPFETEKTRITLGAKGSTHFKDKEVAAVNHFHNAMIGQKEYCTTGDNCTVVCRGKGAVIALASGSNRDVTVPNGGGTVAPGEYTDEITGSKWTVTSTEIKGHVGDTGIAVVYNPSDAPTPSGSVSASPATGTTFTDTLSVTLNAKNVTDAKYSTSEGDSGSYTDGKKITIGSSTSVGGTVTVTLTGKKADGSEATASYKYTKKDPSATTAVYFDNSSYNWSSVYAYIYTGEGESAKKVAAWPGTAMTKDSATGYYKIEIPEGFENGRIIFTENADATTNRYPADQQPGLEIGGKSMKFSAGNKWEAYSDPTPPDPVPGTPTVTVDKASGSSFTTETYDITLGLKDATSGTYSVDNGPTKTFTSSTKVTIGEGKIGDSTVTVKATAKGSDGKTKDYTFTYEKKYVKKTSNAKAAARAAVASSSPVSGSLCSKYATNPNGMGKEATITIDGSFSDWSEDMLIAQGAAWDVANHWKGGHENCVLDTYSLYGAWDNDNLYIAWQMVNTTDTWARSGDGPLSDGGRVLDVPLILALSVDPSSTSMSNKRTDGTPIWGEKMGLQFTNHVDRLLYMSGKPGMGEPAMFKAVDSAGNTDKSGTTGYADGGIEYKMAQGNIASSIIGLNSSDDPSDVTKDSADWVDYKTFTGSSGAHDTTYDSFYEIKIPFSTLGITKDYLTQNGIGAMVIATRGESGLDCIPFDLTMLDNVSGDYHAGDNTSLEKEDEDVITVPFARLGKGGDGPTPPVPPDPTLPLQVNFGADRSAPQEAGTALTLKGIGYGGSGSGYKYEFIVDGETVQASSSKDSYSWDLTGGSHTIECKITDSKGNTATSSKTYTGEGDTPVTPLKNNSTVSATSVTYGNTVTFTGRASGGESPYEYRFEAKHSTASDYTVIKDYDDAGSTKSWKPSKTGTYTLRATVRDNNGDEVPKTFNLTVSSTTTTLKNNSTISATSVAYGKTITFTGKASGGAGSYKYRFAAKHSTASDYTILKDYNDAGTTKVWKPTKTGTYTILTRVQDKSGKNVAKTFTLTVKAATAELKNNSTISATSIAYGKTITFTGKASGGAGSYKYRFAAKHSTAASYTILKDYNDAGTTKVWKPTKTGTYNILIRVQDKSGKNVAKTYTLKVTAALANNSTISATSITYGKTITFTGKASGGAGSYQYRFAAKHSTASSYTILKDYNTTTTKVWKPTKTGTYNVLIRVKDKAGKNVAKNYTLKVTAALANNSTISATSIAYGKTITFTGKASGGAGSYQYRFAAKHSTASSYTILKDYNTTATKVWKPTKTGTYNVLIRVKDKAGKNVAKTYTLKVTASALKNNTTISASSINYGETVTFNGKASGGTAPYQYRFAAKHSTASSYTILKDYNTTATKVWRPTKTGTYTLLVRVKDKAGKVASSTYTLSVRAALANNSTISATSAKVGATIKMTAKASGGTSPYTYEYYNRPYGSDNAWVKLSSTASTCSRTFYTAGKYQLAVRITDAKGTTEVKYFTLNVTK